MTNTSVHARGMTVRLTALAAILIAASWLIVPAALPESGAIQRVAAAGNCNTHVLSVIIHTVSPTTGTPTTNITFTVVVQDTGGCSLDLVRLRFPGQLPSADMTYVGGDLMTGATYRLVRTLAIGSWNYGFRVRNGSTGTDQDEVVTPTYGPIVISAPVPTPTPKPTPKPTHKPKPTLKPKPSPSPSPAIVPVAGTIAPPGLGPFGPADRDHGPLGGAGPVAAPQVTPAPADDNSGAATASAA